MFGYVIANKQELKLREFDVYQSYYCGLCRTLKQRSGIRGQVTLSYDMTFLILLLSGMYEPETPLELRRCVLHPLHRHQTRRNEFSEYAADMNLLMSYYKCLDDWTDEKKKSRWLMAKVLSGKCRTVEKRYPEKAEKMKEHLKRLSRYEEDGVTDPDLLSGCFGELMAELFAVRKDLWEKHLRGIGFYLGKFIYLMDAYEDLEADMAEGRGNPFAARRGEPDFEEYVKDLLELMMAGCAAEFEYLPVIRDAEILRNILYSGVWCRYELVRHKKEEKDKETEDAGSV